MTPLNGFPIDQRRQIGWVLTDIDDTLTLDGRLPAIAYSALERLREAGLKVVPITGRPAGWCDLIARIWPVDAVVGENGALWFSYDDEARVMHRRYWKSAEARAEDAARLDVLRDRIIEELPAAAVSADQPYRESDLAIDFCEDVPRLPRAAIDRILALFAEAGATAKESSIHINGWFGDYDKLAMTRLLFSERFGVDLDDVRDRVVFSGDSPNDAPMFAYFPNAVGVSNVRDFVKLMPATPRWVTPSRGGLGFAELTEALVSARAR